MVRVAVGRQPRAPAGLLVPAVQARHAAQEPQRVDDVLVPARRRLGDQDLVAPVRLDAADRAVGGAVEAAVELRRVGLALAVLGEQELGLVRLVPDRPHRDLVAVAARERGHEPPELLRARPRQVVLLGGGRPLGHRAGRGEHHVDAARAGLADDVVEPAPRARGVFVRVRGVEARLRLAIRVGRERLPVHDLPDLGDPERPDLVERRVTPRVVEQLGGCLERHDLARRRVGGRREQGEERDGDQCEPHGGVPSEPPAASRVAVPGYGGGE